MEKRIVYIRHGEDRESSHKYDEKLTPEGKIQARKLAKKLIKKYGLPDVIYYSPFFRARETRKEMVKAITEFRDNLEDEQKNKRIKLKLDPRLGRFFTRKERANPDISSSTKHKGAIINERWKDFKERVESQLNDAFSNDYKIIWNITHTLVLLHVAELQDLSRDSHVEYLDTVILF